MTKSLTIEQARALMARPSTAANVYAADMAKRDWLTLTDKTALLEAIDHDAPAVFLSVSNRMYNITYRMIKDQPSVWVQAVGSYVPCASLTIYDLRREVNQRDLFAAV